jgi:hypothetical protein
MQIFWNTGGTAKLRFRRTDVSGPFGVNFDQFIWDRIKNGISTSGPKIRWDDDLRKKDDVLAERSEVKEIGKIKLPLAQIFALRAGYYQNLQGCGKLPVHHVRLERDVYMFLLTIGFLKRFLPHEAVAEIFSRVDGFNTRDQYLNAGRVLKRGIIKKRATLPPQMVGYLGIYDAQNLADIINPALEGDIQLAIPTEAQVSVLFANRRFRRVFSYYNVAYVITASRYHAGEIEVEDTTSKILDNSKIDEADEFVHRGAYRDPETGLYLVDRNNLSANKVFNSGIVFEVLPKAA